MNFLCNDNYVLNILKENYRNIVDFFELNLSVNINIKVLNISCFKKEFKNYLNEECDLNTTGFIEDDKYTIIYLNYKDWIFTNHKNESKEEYNKVIVHELVHLIHSIYCNKNYPDDDIYEGIAYFLANQTNSIYYSKFNKLFKKHSKEEILKMLK